MATRGRLVEFVLDLAVHEATRLTAVLAAMDDWDPGRCSPTRLKRTGCSTRTSTPISRRSTRCWSPRACSMTRRDPAADGCRRAWVGCPGCADGAGCPRCRAGATCDEHWRFLLAAEPHRLFLQCPRCLHRWWLQTREVDGHRPSAADALPDWPGHRGAA